MIATTRPKSALLWSLWPIWVPQIIRMVSEWAEKRRIMSKYDSPDAGLPWNLAKVPYTRYIMDLFSTVKIRKLVLKWATQTCKTNLMLNCMGYTMDERPGPIMVVYPTGETVERASTTRIEPMIRACPTLHEKRTKQWKRTEMHYHGGVLYLASSQSGSELSSAPIEVAIGDELKDWPAYTSMGRGADPVKYLSDRQKQFPYTKKLLLVSSPSLEDAPISKHLQSCEAVLFYWVPCPHCAEKFRFSFKGRYSNDFNTIMGTSDAGGVRFGKERWPAGTESMDSGHPGYWQHAKKYAYYECPHCKGEITDRHKPRMVKQGQWLDAEKEPLDGNVESVGAILSSIYSLDLKFGDIAYEFLECKGDLEKFMNFVTGWLALDWKQKVADVKTSDILSRKCDLPPRTVPKQAVALTCGVDVQKHGFYFAVWAWSVQMESWLVEYGYLTAWEEVEKLIFETNYPVMESEGVNMGIWRAAVDTGGGPTDEGWSKTEEIYSWLRGNGRNVAWGVKGEAQKSTIKVRHSILDKMPGTSGRPIVGGLTIWLINVDLMKETLMWRFSNEDDHPQALHLHSETKEDFAKHILAEEARITKKGTREWVRVSRDNHWLDCSVYAHAAADPQWARGVTIFGHKRPKQAKRPVSRSTWIGKKENWFGKG